MKRSEHADGWGDDPTCGKEVAGTGSRYGCDTWRELAEAVERIERDKETAIVEGPRPTPPVERLPRVWHAFFKGRYIGTGQSADHAEGLVWEATARPDRRS